MMPAYVDGIAEFSDFIGSLGYEPPARIEPGQWLRFPGEGKRHGNTSGRAKLFPDLEGGIVLDYSNGGKWTWQAKREKPRSAEEQRAFRERCEKAKREAERARAIDLKQTAERAEKIWRESKAADDSHPYLKRKGVASHGLRIYRGPLALREMRCDGALIVPRRTAGGDLVSLQFIAADGEKRYLNGPATPGAYFSIGKPDGTLCIAEGFATAASIHAATGYAVAVAFDAANLEPTAKALRAKFADVRLIVCADDDWQVKRNGEPYNPGVEYATVAARAVGGMLAVPTFGANRPENATDFNDCAQLHGPEAVQKALEDVQAPAPVASQAPAPGNRSGAVLASGAPIPAPTPGGDWPGALDPEALQGLAGDIVRSIEPHTEADPAAILIQTLIAFGALVGKGPHVRVEGDEHHARLFSILVGRTGKGRKGTSWGRVRELFEPIMGWPRTVDGLSSGEGLKWAVRDPVRKLEKDKQGVVTEVEVDGGVPDKRVLVMESEFAQVLRQCARLGNTLSATIRSAWDNGNLQTLTRNDPITATGAHICAIGHITSDELRAELTATDSANGFANRFLFMAVERSKCLPFGGAELDPEIKAELRDRIERAAVVAKTRGQITFSPEGREAWQSVYPVLSQGHTGLLGAVTARAEAQTLRLALVFALMDEAAAIDLPHLQAALAVWERCEASARYVFGSALGDRVADAILQALRAAGDEGVTRTKISALFSKNETAERIGAGLALLESRGLARRRKSDGAGRPAEIWGMA